MVGWYHAINGREFEQTQRDSEGQGSLECCSSQGCRVVESDMTAQLNNNKVSSNMLLMIEDSSKSMIASVHSLQFFFSHTLCPIQYYCYCSDGHQFWPTQHSTLFQISLIKVGQLLVRMNSDTFPCLIIPLATPLGAYTDSLHFHISGPGNTTNSAHVMPPLEVEFMGPVLPLEFFTKQTFHLIQMCSHVPVAPSSSTTGSTSSLQSSEFNSK